MVASSECLSASADAAGDLLQQLLAEDAGDLLQQFRRVFLHVVHVRAVFVGDDRAAGVKALVEVALVTFHESSPRCMRWQQRNPYSVSSHVVSQSLQVSSSLNVSSIRRSLRSPSDSFSGQAKSPWCL